MSNFLKINLIVLRGSCYQGFAGGFKPNKESRYFFKARLNDLLLGILTAPVLSYSEVFYDRIEPKR
ncbi:MAG: hypothetical protein CVV47_14945 [Spirochaetae bacterium HGW-Spirochaetae-3]|nr:MAG: hypothetical protein CVV47_14945 [Spirochaetae bacterium HGW-Spirochaetae-3]